MSYVMGKPDAATQEALKAFFDKFGHGLPFPEFNPVSLPAETLLKVRAATKSGKCPKEFLPKDPPGKGEDVVRL